MSVNSAAADMVARASAVLLDFDGPVCGIFAGYRAHDIAAELTTFLAAEGVDLPPGVANEPDPLEVLRWTALRQPGLTRLVEERLCAAEREAVKSAVPADSAADAIRAICGRGQPIAIVSNNSGEAIVDYLNMHDLAPSVSAVIGRPYSAPGRMKPNPDGLFRALALLNVKPEASVLVGDSVSDVKASLAAGVRPIGYAKNGDRAEALTRTGAEAVIGSMAELLNPRE